jgi:drug/metabolite transporter (DMT)-like permease
MLYLVLGVVLTSVLILMFKVFDRFGVNNVQAIVVNYLTAGIISMLHGSEVLFGATPVYSYDWFPITVILGVLFFITFNFIGITAREVAVSVSVVANKMSVVIPLCFAFFFLKEEITGLKIAGIVLSLVSVYLTTIRSEEDKKESPRKGSKMGMLLFPIIVFVGSGIIDTMIKYLEEYHLDDHVINDFLIISFMAAFVSGLIYSTVQLVRGKWKFDPKSIIGGIVLGIPNYYSLHYLMKALNQNNMESSQIFPINNIGIVLLTTLGAYLLFREKLSKINLLGVGLAIVAILLIAA